MCNHSETIEDSGSEVCTLCGLVMDPIYHLPLDPIYSQPTDTITFDSEFPPETILRNDLLDVLALIHQDSYFITERIISFLKSHCSTLPQFSTHAGRSIIAFAIWEVLNQNECPHSPTEIAYFCHVRPNDIQKAERKLNTAPTFCPPSMYVHRFIANLGLPRPVASTVVAAVKSVNNCMRQPETVVGAVLLILQDELRRVRAVEFPNNIHEESLAPTLGISAFTLKKMKRELPGPCRYMISGLAEVMSIENLPTIAGTLV